MTSLFNVKSPELVSILKRKQSQIFHFFPIIQVICVEFLLSSRGGSILNFILLSHVHELLKHDLEGD